VDLRYAKHALAALVGWEGSPIPTPLGAFDTSILAPSALSFCGPQCKILATPLSVLGTKCCLSILSLAEVLTMKKRVDVQLFIRIAAAAD